MNIIPATSAVTGILGTRRSKSTRCQAEISGGKPGAPGARRPWRRSAGFPAQDFLLDLLQAGVAHVAALDEVDDVLADVARMIADAFQRARRPDDIEHARDGAWVFHHEGDELADGALVFLVHL